MYNFSNFIFHDQLTFKGIKVTSVQVITPGEKRNVIKTHWSRGYIYLSRGLDFKRNTPIFTQIQQLNHQEFQYSFTILNKNPREVKATIRVFMAPQRDLTNTRKLSFEEQRRLMIEMDKFTYKCRYNLIPEVQSMNLQYSFVELIIFKNLSVQGPRFHPAMDVRETVQKFFFRNDVKGFQIIAV